MPVRLACDGCKRRSDNVKLREKTLADFSVARVRMCTPCARKHGYSDIDYDRGRHSTLGAYAT